MAPYAKNVYDNLLSALDDQGWRVKPFYYDFRKDIRDNGELLSNYVNTNSNESEKVNIVGHSMGGLIGRSYLEVDQGQKISSLFTVASAHQGIVQTYGTVSGGEIWEDNLIVKIAETIYLKRCGNVASLKNFLPIFDYLRDVRTNTLKPVEEMQLQNNWLPTNFSSPFWGVKIGTLSGNSFPTLNVIKVTNPSKNDIKQNKWADGKPIGKEYVNSGDGLVLNKSSQISGVFNSVINQNHSGVVASSQGIDKILEFVGNPQATAFQFVKSVFAKNKPNNKIFVEPTSALVVIGYPSNFWIKDKTGKMIQDTQGVIAIMNPSAQEYELQIIPRSNDTLFIITQFLSNGKTLYKEYHFKNLQPKTRIIDFDPKKSSDDILKEKARWGTFWDFFKH